MFSEFDRFTKPKIIFFASISVVSTTLMALFIWSANNQEQGQQSSSLQATEQKTKLKGEVHLDHGYHADMGSSGQSFEILEMINDSPGKADYQITYYNEIDTLVFGCNLKE